jgi:hypothetical protein
MNKKFFLRTLSEGLGILALLIAASGAGAPILHAQAPAAPPNPAPLAADMRGKTADQFYKKIEAL